MKLYKFLHKQHAASILGGTFLFKDYRTFRDLPPPIGDPKEGLASLEVGKPYAFNDADGPGALGPIFKFEGEWSAKAYPIQIEGLTIQYELPDLFISCFSVGDPSALEREMLHKKPERYDAAVEIVDEGLLREFLWREGVVRELGLPLRSVAKVIGNPVQYIETPPEPPIAQDFLSSAPWRKLSTYRHQREYRFAAAPHVKGTLPKAFFVDCPAASWMVSRR